MAINFPTSPSLNDTYTTGGITWTWDGSTWKASSSFSETDPVYTASAAANVTNTKITNWDTSYGWGDHGTVGYLTSYTETDPAFNASAASTITGTQVTNWDTAYGWGNHASAGYITTYSETGTLADVTGRGATTSSNLTLGGIVQFNNNSAFANNKVLNFGGSSNGRILYVSATNSFDVRVPGGGEDLKLGAGTAVRITNENGLTDRAVFTASGLTVTGKLLYSNNYATTGDLPNATTYHGMFAHVHAEGHGYFAHAGAWTQLVDTGSNLSELADVATTAPSTSDVLTWDGANWGPAAPTGGGGANVTIADTAPGSASAGDLWWESDKGRLKIYYNDTDSTQWVDASPPLTNANVPVHVGEVELWQGGNQITWLGSGGVTAAIRATEGGGGFQSPCIRVTFAQPFSSSDSYTIQATVYNPSTIGHVYQTSIRKTGPQHFDFQVYNLTSSAVATDFKVAITIYAI